MRRVGKYPPETGANNKEEKTLGSAGSTRIKYKTGQNTDSHIIRTPKLICDFIFFNCSVFPSNHPLPETFVIAHMGTVTHSRMLRSRLLIGSEKILANQQAAKEGEAALY